MTAPTLKLVPNDPIETEINEIEGSMLSAKKAALMKRGGPGGDVLPPVDIERYDDLANSKRFLDIIGDEMLYVPEQKKWMIWQGSHWAVDREDFVFQFARDFAGKLYDDADNNEAYKNAQRANNQSGFNAFTQLSMRQKSTPISTLDDQGRTSRLLNCRNGTLDLRTGDLRGHEKADRITRVVRCDYVEGARSETFETFLKRIQPDPDVRAFLQRSIGYSLLGTSPERAFWILYGTGNNGKSIFTNLFINLLDGYASTTPSATLMQKRGDATNDIARLRAKRLCVVPETEENERINAAMIKAMSAGDIVTARFLFAEFFDFEFTAKLWIATNHKPTVTDHSKGFWDRCKLIPFAIDIPESEVIKKDELMRRLMADAPAVLAWAVQGARDYFEMAGLDVPRVIQDEIDAYRKEQDSIAQFLEERCQTIEQAREIRPDRYFADTEFEVTNSELYSAYEKFCKSNGEYQRSHRRFTQNMLERGFRQGRQRSRYWEGLRLIDTSGL